MTHFFEYFISIKFPEFCKIYLETISNVFNYYTLHHDNISLITYNGLKIVIISELNRLEAFYVDQTFTNIKTEVLKNPYAILTALTYEIDKCIYMLNENLIFVN